jgi:transcriptional regulator with XRE-family HTH domain
MRRGRKEAELGVDTPKPSNIGDALRRWRHLRGLTVTELAVQAGFGLSGRSYISKIEHGAIRHIGESKLQAILQALAIRAEDLHLGQLDAWGSMNQVDYRPANTVSRVQSLTEDLPMLFQESAALPYINELAMNFTGQGSADPVLERVLLQIEAGFRNQLHRFVHEDVRAILVTFFEDVVKSHTSVHSTP